MTSINQNNTYRSIEIMNVEFINPEHRENMTDVLDELLYVTNYTTCDNDNCEAELHTNQDDCVTSWFETTEYQFCNEDCKSYGMWSIRYDIRKSRRMGMYNATLHPP